MGKRQGIKPPPAKLNEKCGRGRLHDITKGHFEKFIFEQKETKVTSRS
jgi:hypothetical protein